MLRQGKPNPESPPQSKTEACTSPKADRLGRKFPDPGYLEHRRGEEWSWMGVSSGLMALFPGVGPAEGYLKHIAKAGPLARL